MKTLPPFLEQVIQELKLREDLPIMEVFHMKQLSQVFKEVGVPVGMAWRKVEFKNIQADNRITTTEALLAFKCGDGVFNLCGVCTWPSIAQDFIQRRLQNMTIHFHGEEHHFPAPTDGIHDRYYERKLSVIKLRWQEKMAAEEKALIKTHLKNNLTHLSKVKKF